MIHQDHFIPKAEEVNFSNREYSTSSSSVPSNYSGEADIFLTLPIHYKANEYPRSHVAIDVNFSAKRSADTKGLKQDVHTHLWGFPISETAEQKLLKKVISRFEDNINLYSEELKGHENEVSTYFYNTLNFAFSIKPTNILFDFTSLESFSFRVFKDFNEIYLNIFFIKEDDDEGIEVVTTIYSNDKIVAKMFGELSEVFTRVRSLVQNHTPLLVS